MEEYIEKAAIIPALEGYYEPINPDFPMTLGLGQILEVLQNMPAADVVQVVRCKNCIHSISYVDKSGAIAYVVCNLDEDSDEIELRTPMDYCSYGEREEANT